MALDKRIVLAVAARASCDPRSVQRFLGGQIEPSSLLGSRIRAALTELEGTSGALAISSVPRAT